MFYVYNVVLYALCDGGADGGGTDRLAGQCVDGSEWVCRRSVLIDLRRKL